MKRFQLNPELKVIFEDILVAAIELAGSDFGNIQIVDPITKKLRIVAERGEIVVEDAEQNTVFSIPLIGRSGNSVGVFSIHKKPGCPSEASLRKLESLARIAADAIEQSQLRLIEKEVTQKLREAVALRDDF